MAANRSRGPAAAARRGGLPMAPPGYRSVLQDSPSMQDDGLASAANPLMLMLEARAPWECAVMLAALPWLHQLPKGDGHPVIVYPGFGASDISTLPLRQFLANQGYDPHPWQQGFNLGPRRGVFATCRSQLARLAAPQDRPVSLIGWSLGGLYARELAKEQPHLVRCVITLGSPFASRPQATGAWRLLQLIGGRRDGPDPAQLAQMRLPPPLPTTSIYSRTDGVVAWQCSLNADEPLAENIEVHASHLGMGMNPLALFAIADRLRQPVGHWQRFDVRGARRWFYRARHHAPLRAARVA
jgi:pimeloyl-ACP methyl ester carboxylesterase